jgi:hypothetical protein
MWYIINKQTNKQKKEEETGNSWKSDPNIVLKIGIDKITNLQIVADMLNSFFIEHVEAFFSKK